MTAESRTAEGSTREPRAPEPGAAAAKAPAPEPGAPSAEAAGPGAAGHEAAAPPSTVPGSVAARRDRPRNARHTPPSLRNPLVNRGLAFSAAERDRLGLTGRLPSGVLSLEAQAARAYAQMCEQPTDLQRNIFLEQLHDRNETVYYKVLTDHLTELLPIVYDPTVGEAIKRYSDEYREPRGVYLSIDRPEDIERSLSTLGLGSDDVDLIVCTDAEAILGIGDWGANGMQISVGKLAVYSAGAGIDPARTIAVSLDVGTDNELLLNDPFYVGNRHARRRGAGYDAFIDAYVQTASRLFPHALLHFEDFGPEHAREILMRYGKSHRVFNDDVQGTGCVVLAAATSALRRSGARWRDQRLVVFGAGCAGAGVADQVTSALIADGVAPEQAAARVWLVDTQGLLFDHDPELRDYQRPYARSRASWSGPGGAVSLLDTILAVRPTMLVGTSTQPGAFTQEIVEAMCRGSARPMIFPISNPTERIEAQPADVIAWSHGVAQVAVGIPVDPVEFDGVAHVIGQANNFLVYPGIGLGVTVARARLVTPRMLRAAAEAVASMAPAGGPGASLLPDVRNLRAMSATVARAVVDAAVADGVAEAFDGRPERGDVIEAVHAAMWQVAYPDAE